MIVLKITHFSYALLPFARAAKDPGILQRNFAKHFPIGHPVKIVVGKKTDAYCYEASIPGALAAAAPRLKAFTQITGEVAQITPLWAHVELGGGVKGRIHITDARDMYSK